MARYRKHIITRDDTLQSIAQRYTGSSEYWKSIVTYNKLEYPYFVDTPAEKLKQPESVLTLGDTVIIPIEQNLLDVDTDSLGTRDKDLILKLSLGSDLNISRGDKRYKQHGTRDEVFELVGDGKGDIALAQGVENIKQVVIARLLTKRGSLINSPNYGSDLDDLIGRPANSLTLKMVDNEIQQVLKTDGRVSEVTRVHSQIDKEVYSGEFEVYIYSTDELFRIIVEGGESGLVIR